MDGVATSSAPDATEAPAAAAASYQVLFVADNKWEGGFQGTIKINNTGKKTLKDWKLVFDYDVDFDSSWN